MDVSVIIPTFNCEKFILEAIESVFCQTFKGKTEVIVVDDGSTDNTRSVLTSYLQKIKHIYQENKGPSAARNRGIKEARGEYIAFLDADDIWKPEKLSLQLDFLYSHSEIALAFSDFEECNSEGIVISESFLKKKKCYGNILKSREKIESAFQILLLENFIPTGTVIVKRKVFDRIGLFDESLRSVEDRDMWLRIAAYYDIAFIPPILMTRRRHETNLSMNSKLFAMSYLKLMKKISRMFPEYENKNLYDRLISEAYFNVAYGNFLSGNLKACRKNCLKSLMAAWNYRSIKIFLLSLLGNGMLNMLRKCPSRNG